MNISLMWAGRYLTRTLQPKFRSNVQLARVLAETLKISANTKQCSSVGELISTPRIINNICRLQRAVTHSLRQLAAN
jgi:hypothetical protein